MIEILVDNKKTRVNPTSLDVVFPLGNDASRKTLTFDSGQKIITSTSDAAYVLAYAGNRIEVTIDGRKVNLNASAVNIISPLTSNSYAIFMDCGDRYILNKFDADRVAAAAEPRPDWTYIDTVMSDTSAYAVQNRVIKKYVDTKSYDTGYLKVDKYQGTSYGLDFTQTGGRFLGIDATGYVRPEVMPIRTVTKSEYDALPEEDRAAAILYTVEL